MTRLAVLLTALLIALGAGALPGGASACACGEFHGFVVARGESLYGVPWQIEANHPRTDSFGHRGVEFWFDIEPPGYLGVGYFVGMPFPISNGFVFTADSGSELDPHPESDLSGIAGSQVATLTVNMSQGDPLTIYPQRAPQRLLNRFPWLRRLRFFDQFFAADLDALKVIARDREGHILASRKSQHGSFFG